MTTFILIPDGVKIPDHGLGVAYYGRFTHRSEVSVRRTTVRRGTGAIQGPITLEGVVDPSRGGIREQGFLEFTALRNNLATGTIGLQIPLSKLIMYDMHRTEFLRAPQLPTLANATTHSNGEWQNLNFVNTLSSTSLYTPYINAFIEIGGRVTQVMDITSTSLVVNPPLDIRSSSISGLSGSVPTFPIRPVAPAHSHIYLIMDQRTPTLLQTPARLRRATFNMIEHYGPITGTQPPATPDRTISRGTEGNFVSRQTEGNYVQRAA